MHGTGAPTTAPQRGDHDSREFSRIPLVIPVRVEVFPTPPAAGFAAVPGVLLNIGRGGGRVRVRWEIPPRTHLFISLPVGSPSLRLLAEVVSASHPSDRGPEPAVYGLRWAEPLSSGILGSVLLHQGLANTWEVAHGRGAWWR